MRSILIHLTEMKWIQGQPSKVTSLVPEKNQKEMREKLENMGINTERYLQLSTCLSIMVTLVAAGTLLLISPLVSLGISLVLFSTLTYFFLKLPLFLHRKHEGEVEKSLAKSIRVMATELSVNTPFHTCLQHASEEETPAAKEIRRAVKSIRRGSSIPESLAEVSKRHRSPFIKRAVNQMISVYSGDSSEGSKILKKVAKEHESILKSRMKEYNQKLVIYSLIFIVVSAVFPAMFQAFVIIGSNFLNINITPLQALLIPSVGFPLMNLSLFTYITSKRP